MNCKTFCSPCKVLFQFNTITVLVLLTSIKFIYSEKIVLSNVCEDSKSMIHNGAKHENESITKNDTNQKSNESFLLNYKNGFRGGCKNSTCLRKCCPKGEIYNIDLNKTFKCVGNVFSSEKIYCNMKNYGVTNNMTIISKEIRKNCQDKRLLPTNGSYMFNSSGILINNDKNKVVAFDNYCFEFFHGGKPFLNNSYFLICSEPLNKIEEPAIKIKLSEDDSDIARRRLARYPYYMLTSLPFLIIMVLIHAFVPGLNNFPGKCLASFTFSKLIAFILLILIQWYANSFCLRICKLLGYLVVFTMLSSFFWLNAMCFDIWSLFRGYSSSNRRLSKEKEIRKYLKFASYSWGVPLLICLIIYLLNEQITIPKAIKPGIGDDSCALSDSNYAGVIFYFFPLTILFLLNITFFSLTAIKVFIHRKDIDILNSKGNQISRKDKERLNIYFKFFIFMGIPWLAEPLSAFCNNKPHYFWEIMDAINMLQSLPIFIIIISNKRTLRKINDFIFSTVKFYSSESKSEYLTPTAKQQNSEKYRISIHLNPCKN